MEIETLIFFLYFMKQFSYNVHVVVIILSLEPLEKPKRKIIWDPTP